MTASPVGSSPGERVLQRPDGVRIWFDVQCAGGAPPIGGIRRAVVLCAPGGRNAAYWPQSWIEELCAAGFDVVRFDWRGQGRSDWSAGPEPTDADVLVDDLGAVLDAVVPAGRTGPAALHLVGVGLGGWVAARWAQRCSPAAVRAGPAVAPGTAAGHLVQVVLFGASAWWCDPALPGPTEPTVVALALRRRGGGPDDHRRAVRREAAAELAGTGPLDGDAMRAEVDRWFNHGFHLADDHRVAWLAAPPLADAPLAATIDVVVVHGSRDPVVPVAHGRRLAAVLGGRFLELGDVGHHATAATLAVLADELLDATQRGASAPGELVPDP